MSIYRESALAERLRVNLFEIPVRIIRVSHWFVVLTIFLGSVFFGLWAISYQVPEYAMAEGVVVDPQSVVGISAAHQGRITEVLVDQQDHVEPGKAVATIEMVEMDLEIEMLKDKAERLKAAHQEKMEREQADLEAFQQRNNEKISVANELISRLEIQIEEKTKILDNFNTEILFWAEKKQDSNTLLAKLMKDVIADYETANREYDDGSGSLVIGREQIMQVQDRLQVAEQRQAEAIEKQKQLESKKIEERIAITQLRQRVADARHDINQHRQALREKKTELRGKNLDRVNTLKDQLGQIKEKESKREKKRCLTAAERGRIISINKIVGDVVSAGDRVATLMKSNARLEDQKCIAYFEIGAGSRVRLGDRAYVTPNTHKREQDGSILGIVAKTDEFLSSRESAFALLGHEKLAEELLKESNLKQITILLLDRFTIHMLDEVIRKQTGYDLLSNDHIGRSQVLENLQIIQSIQSQRNVVADRFDKGKFDESVVRIGAVNGHSIPAIELTKERFQSLQGYAWTGSEPADFEGILPGTTASVRIRTGSKVPIAYAFATMRKWLGESDKDQNR